MMCRMLAMQILAEAAGDNATNGTNASESSGGQGPTLQSRGVNINHWPMFERVNRQKHSYNDSLPGAEAPEGDANSTKDEGDMEPFDDKGRKKLEDKGVKVGGWFWDDYKISDKEFEGEGGNATNGTEGEEAGSNATNATGGGDDDESPDDFMTKQGVNVDMPLFSWDQAPSTMPKVKLEHKAVGEASFQQLYKRGGEGGLFDVMSKGAKEGGQMMRGVRRERSSSR